MRLTKCNVADEVTDLKTERYDNMLSGQGYHTIRFIVTYPRLLLTRLK
jgi:hypothetical protein